MRSTESLTETMEDASLVTGETVVKLLPMLGEFIGVEAKILVDKAGRGVEEWQSMKGVPGLLSKAKAPIS